MCKDLSELRICTIYTYPEQNQSWHLEIYIDIINYNDIMISIDIVRLSGFGIDSFCPNPGASHQGTEHVEMKAYQAPVPQMDEGYIHFGLRDKS